MHLIFESFVQARQPFSAKSRLYIADLNVEKESELLRAHGLQLRRECERVRKVITATRVNIYQTVCHFYKTYWKAGRRAHVFTLLHIADANLLLLDA